MKISLILVLIGLTICLFPTHAQVPTDSTDFKYLISLDIEQILNTKVNIATKTEQTMEQAPSVVTVVTQQEIQNMGARELIDVLQMVPGFEVTRNSTGSILIGVRGVKDPRFPCKILLLQDGRPVNNIFYGSADDYGYQYDLDNVERIEIIRGPGSAVYGRNAFSAVINLISKTGKTNQGATVKAELGTFNTLTGRLAYGYNKNDFNFRLSGYAVTSDGSDAVYPGTNEPWSVQHNNQVVNADLGYQALHVTFTLKNKKSGNESTCAGEQTGLYMLEYQYKLSDKVNFHTRFYGQNAHLYEDIEIAKPDASTGSLGLYVLPEWDEYMYAAELESNIHLFEGNDFTIGTQADLHGVNDATITSNFNFDTGEPYPGVGRDNQIKWEPGWVKDNGHDFQNIAFYFQDIYYPTEKLGLTLGGRYDIESQTGGVFNPRLGVVYQFTPKASCKLLYGQAFRSPSVSQQYQTSGFALGNEDLKIEQIQTFETSFSYRLDNMITQVNLFRNLMTDMIYAEKYITVDVTHTPSNRNMGKNVATGIEFENKWAITKQLYTLLNYSYTVSENTDEFYDGSTQTYDHVDVAPHKLNAGVNYSFLKYFNLYTSVMYRSKMKKFFTYDAATDTYHDVSQDPVGNYAIFNSTLRMVELTKGLELSASVYNILNTKYYAQEAFIPHVPEQGNRQFIVSCSYQF